MYTPLYLRWKTNKDLLYSTGNSAQCYVTAWMGGKFGGRMDICIGMAESLCCPRDSQESSPTPQFKSINSLALSLLYVPTLTSVHDYGKNHSFDPAPPRKPLKLKSECNPIKLVAL